MAKNRNAAEPAPSNDGETITEYFRRVFAETPKLLRIRSNKKVLARWLADHPGHSEVPESVKTSLANLKSSLRHKKRKRRKAIASAAEIAVAPAAIAVPKPSVTVLERLEEKIDDCLTAARQFDRDEFEEVIRLLRRARNAVVWKLGQ